MAVFWSIAAVALLFATWRLTQSLAGRVDARQHLPVIEALQSDLSALQKAGIEPTEKDQREIQLAKSLISEVNQPDLATPESPAFILLLAMVIGMGSVFLYLEIGNPGAIDQGPAPGPQKNAQTTPTKDGKGPTMEAAIAELQRKLEADPDNPEGWILLGQSYANMRNYAAAVTAYKQAMKYQPNSPDLMVELAESHLMSANSDQFPTEASDLLHAALKINPQHDKALWLLGLQAFSEERWLDAVSYWEILLPLLPAGNVQKTIADKLAEARNLAGLEPVTSSDQSAAQPAIAKKEITVSVDISDDALATADAGDTLFVYARAATGPAMPLAIKRLNVSDLPVTVNLSDADGMMPQMKLSNFDQVVVIARISKSGSATTQPGDRTASSEPVQLDGPLTLDLMLR